MRLKGKGANLAGRIGPTLFSNICFGKIEARPIMVPMDAIDIGNAGTAAAAGTLDRGPMADSEAVLARGIERRRRFRVEIRRNWG